MASDSKLKAVVLQLLNDRSSHRYFDDYYAYNPPEAGQPIKIKHFDCKLFLRIFSQVKKKHKRLNQFQVAEEVKRLFAEANAENAFVFSWEIIDSSDQARNHLNSISKLIDNLRLSDNAYEYLYNNYLFGSPRVWDSLNDALTRLAEYYLSASPAAIVQMRKRIKKYLKTASSTIIYGNF